MLMFNVYTNANNLRSYIIVKIAYFYILFDGHFFLNIHKFLRAFTIKNHIISLLKRKENHVAILQIHYCDGDLNFLIFCKLIFTNSRMRFDMLDCTDPSFAPEEKLKHLPNVPTRPARLNR